MDDEDYCIDQKEADELEALIRAKNPSTRSAIWCALNILISVAADSNEPSQWAGSATPEDHGPLREWRVTVEWSTPSRAEIPEA